MVLGIGTDILKYGQISFDSLRHNDSFLMKTYTENEQEEGESRSDKYSYYCTRFAGKEAVFKSLNISGEKISLKDIEILSNKNGQPYVILHGNLKQIATEKNIHEVLISLSYDTDYYVAFSIAQSK